MGEKGTRQGYGSNLQELTFKEGEYFVLHCAGECEIQNCDGVGSSHKLSYFTTGAEPTQLSVLIMNF